MTVHHVLVVEDDPNLARFLESELIQEGYRVTVAHDGLAGLLAVREVQPDLLVLDWILPGLTGVELCQKLRSGSCNIPVIMLTAKDDVPDRVAGLNAGADDYVIKPFNVEELLARIRAHLRWNPPKTTDVLQFEDLSLNPQTRETYRNTHFINLTAKEFDLVEYFIRHPRQIITRCQILDKIWKDDFIGSSNVIEVCIRQLRLKLEANGEKRLIHTVRSIGYVLRSHP